MKIRTNIILTSLIIFFISSTSLAQTDTSRVDSVEFHYAPKISCVQAEVCYLPPLMGEVGGLIDVDLMSNNNKQFIGMRFAVELYGYGNVGGQSKSYTDICIYGRASLRFTDFRINAYGGFSFHTGSRESGGILPRGGIEAKYLPFGKIFAVMLKGSTSFKIDSDFYGVGVAFGHFD